MSEVFNPNFIDRIWELHAKHAEMVPQPLARKCSQAMCVAEEAGEFLKEARRYLGLARSAGDYGKLREELADTVIAALVAAHTFGINIEDDILEKLDKIGKRGGI